MTETTKAQEDDLAESVGTRRNVADITRQFESGSKASWTRAASFKVSEEDYFHLSRDRTSPPELPTRPRIPSNATRSSSFAQNGTSPRLGGGYTPTSPRTSELTTPPTPYSVDRRGSRTPTLTVPAREGRKSHDSIRSDRSLTEQHELDATVQFYEEDSEGHRKSLGAERLLDLQKIGFANLKTFFRNHTEHVGNFVAHTTGDVVDLIKVADEKHGTKSRGLCSTCSKVPFGQFKQSARNTYSGENDSDWVMALSMERILRYRGSCSFCKLLFEALCLRRNDPLQNASVRDYIQEDLQHDSFRQWANRVNWFQLAFNSKKLWPFGHSPDSKEARHAAEDINAAAPTRLSARVMNDRKRAQLLKVLNEMLPMMVGTSKRALPCWVVVRLKNSAGPESGLLVVDVYGYGRAPGAPLDCISHFNLWVGAKLSMGSENVDLRYGRLLDTRRIDLSLAQEWLSHCVEHHGMACSTPNWSTILQKPNGIPFRLIDVFAEKLIDIDEPGAYQYACLSYVWGDHKVSKLGRRASKLNHKSIQRLYETGSLSPSRPAVPRTIRGAMIATKGIGLQYLWVDSLCITQDDVVEKKMQIDQMDRIYGSAALTIVAADSEHADEGLRGVMPGLDRDIVQIAAEVRPGVNVLIPVEQKSHLNPWDSRAWTLQEKLLSKRLLVFCGDQMHFHCQQDVFHEDMPAKDADNGYPAIDWISPPQDKTESVFSSIKIDPDGSSRLLRSPYFAQYTSLVEQYTRRRMTDSSDALNAIDGLMKVLERSHKSSQSFRLSDHPHFGFPEEVLDLAILWQPSAGEAVRLRRRAMPHGKELPSWAWAAWEAVPKNTNEDSTPRNHKGQHLAWEGGVRYEQPFQVFTDETGAHMRVVPRPGEAEDRMRSVVRWHRWAKVRPQLPHRPSTAVKSASKMLSVLGEVSERPSITAPIPSPPQSPRPRSPVKELIPLNRTGLGLSVAKSTIPRDWSGESELLSNFSVSRSDLPVGVLGQLDEKHLIFRTSIAKFSLGNTVPRTEILWKRFSQSRPQKEQEHIPARELYIYETEILDANSDVIGRIALPDPSQPPVGPYFDFVVISEAQYFGGEDRVGDSGYRLYNVMLIEWDPQRVIASRLALGKVYKRAWKEARPREQVIVLG